MASNRVPYDNWNIVSFYIRERLLRMGYEWEAHVLRERDSPNNGSLGSSHSPQQPPRRAGALQIRPGDPHTAIHGVLRDAGDEISRRYQRDFAEMSGQLHLTPSTARRKFAAVAEELFRDGVNWGRIVAFFEFGGTMCVESVNREMTSQVDHIADWMTDYLNGPLHNWIQDNGGWDAFVELYGGRRSSMLGCSWPSLKTVFSLAALGAAGITIGAYFVQK
ncbi:apoptosis regulator Bcl-2 isoform X2 [Erpetoichthys calabaricus]|uniref:apoptosis regulator Bcl-2 isoform X2 n=1 Tax=Erpetoichthys calabaricus TaxID=27687 RepID=UPI0022346E6B|nr:apoptosis regulator Bcl-2 isoform X2 [Erpetoichthys calabaricus]